MAKHATRYGSQLILTPQTLWAFVLGGVVMGVLGNAVYQLLTNWLSTSNRAAIGIALGALLALWFITWLLGRLLLRMRPAPPLPDKKTPEQRRGLILLISNEPTAQKAMAWHQGTLERCWLVCSEQKKSFETATKLKSELEQQGKKAELILIHDVFDPVECRNKIDAIYTSLPAGLNPSDVILDFTGMTSVVSVGSVLACLDEQRAIQYTPGVYKDGAAVQPRDPVEITLHWGMLRNTNEPSALKEAS